MIILLQIFYTICRKFLLVQTTKALFANVKLAKQLPCFKSYLSATIENKSYTMSKLQSTIT